MLLIRVAGNVTITLPKLVTVCQQTTTDNGRQEHEDETTDRPRSGGGLAAEPIGAGEPQGGGRLPERLPVGPLRDDGPGRAALRQNREVPADSVGSAARADRQEHRWLSHPVELAISPV